MKVLFLDIDGVINCERTRIAYGGFPHTFNAVDKKMFDDVAVSLIRNIVKASGAEVVLSSTWRITHSVESVAKHLRMPVIDSTPRSATGLRGGQIKDWLDRHPDVEQYCIVDDSCDMLSEQVASFVHVNLFDGFMWKDAVKMAEILGISVYDAIPPSPRKAALAWEMQ